MAENTNLDLDYDEYQALEAEAESLARGEKKPTANLADDPNMVPGRVGTSGRGPRPSPVTIVPTRRPQQAPAPRAPPRTSDEEIKELEDSEEEMAEEEAQKAEVKDQKWIAFHQHEKTGLVNTETNEIIEGFKDLGSATGMAKILNEINAIIVSGGYN